MGDLNLQEFETGLKGKPFYKLVQHHLRRQRQDDRIRAKQETIELLPSEVQPAIGQFMEGWNARMRDRDFWHTDAASVFSGITRDAKGFLNDLGASSDDETLFNIFNLVVLQFAAAAYDQSEVKELIPSGGVPWASALALIYPVSAGLYIALNTPASLSMILGYMVANLGYLLVGAGIMSGTFKVFALHRLSHVFIAAAVAIVAGVALTNL